jgi:hypothetical protein
MAVGRLLCLALGVAGILVHAKPQLGTRRTESRNHRFFSSVKKWEVGLAQRIDAVDSSLNTRRQLADGASEHFSNPVFELTGFNRTFVLELKRNDRLFHPDYHEVRIHADGNRTVRGRENCYYHGSVRGDSGSVVSADTCGSGGIAGLQGMITLGSESYAFLPAHNHFNVPSGDTSGGNVPHLLFKKSEMDDSLFKFGAMTVPGSETKRRRNTDAAGDAPTKQTYYFEWGIVNDDQVGEYSIVSTVQ